MGCMHHLLFRSTVMALLASLISACGPQPAPDNEDTSVEVMDAQSQCDATDCGDTEVDGGDTSVFSDVDTIGSLPSIETLPGCPEPGFALGEWLMAFNACVSAGCPPKEHRVYLATSDDGVHWDLLDALGDTHPGSVPDVVIFQGHLYLFHTLSGAFHNWDKLDGCLDVVDQGKLKVEGGDAGDSGWVDPSAIVDGDELVLFKAAAAKVVKDKRFALALESDQPAKKRKG